MKTIYVSNDLKPQCVQLSQGLFHPYVHIFAWCLFNGAHHFGCQVLSVDVHEGCDAQSMV